MYEILFTLLQTHPCYLIRWVQAALRRDVGLFDSHPLAFLVDDTGDVGTFLAARKAQLSLPETELMHDEVCYLLATVFGGLKACYNNRRAAANIMMVGVKVFEYEVEWSAAFKDEVDKPEGQINELKRDSLPI